MATNVDSNVPSIQLRTDEAQFRRINLPAVAKGAIKVAKLDRHFRLIFVADDGRRQDQQPRR
jgi:hypothetical protein